MPKRRKKMNPKTIAIIASGAVLLGIAFILSAQLADYGKTQVTTPTSSSGLNTYVCTCICNRYVPGEGDIALCIVPYEDDFFGRACPDGGAAYQRTVTARDARSAESACYQLTQNGATNTCNGYLIDSGDTAVAGTLVGCTVTGGPDPSTTPTSTPSMTTTPFVSYTPVPTATATPFPTYSASPAPRATSTLMPTPYPTSSGWTFPSWWQ